MRYSDLFSGIFWIGRGSSAFRFVNTLPPRDLDTAGVLASSLWASGIY